MGLDRESECAARRIKHTRIQTASRVCVCAHVAVDPKELTVHVALYCFCYVPFLKCFVSSCHSISGRGAQRLLCWLWEKSWKKKKNKKFSEMTTYFKPYCNLPNGVSQDTLLFGFQMSTNSLFE